MTDSVQSAPALEWSDLAEVFERRHGLRADEAARARLMSAQAERMRSLRIGQADAYRALLERQPDEVQRLLDLFLVGETSFFRTPAYFEALRQQVLPELDRRLPAGARLRVWSAGCSSGEEAYSLAMVCAEQLNGRRPFEVIATDLSVASLERAARGRYGQRSVARLPAYLSERYVERHDSEFVVAASIRERVQWTRLNLVEQPLRVDLRASVHVIFCQNVLIYFTEEALGRALGNLGAALAEGGYLFLGYSERLPTPWPGFDYVWLAGAGAWRKSGSSGQEAGDRRQEAGDRRQEAGDRRQEAGGRRQEAGGRRQDVDGRRQVADARRQPRDRELNTQHPTPGTDTAEGLLLAAQAYADLGREDEALDHAMRAASLAPLSEDAHALVGTLLARRGRVAEALMAFDRALYLAPEAPLVRFQFAGLLRDMGRSARARREFVNLAAWLERLPPEETVGELSARLLASACRDQAEKLK